MLDPKATELADKFVCHQFDERTEQLRRIQTVGSLKPAYDTLKTALIPFGMSLP
jgi:hypothetical protein